MKIKKISCEQFAGIRDIEVTFDDGINVVFGKNESGKSTLVHLISRTLFQKARIDGRSDKDFRELYYPAALKQGEAGDSADGKITFETEKGLYTLTKEWAKDSRCTLSTPSGIIRDQDRIDSILREVLQYGEGVYADLLFSSQRNTDRALQTLLDATIRTDSKQEITDAVTKAFAESDGIPVDAIGQAINAEIYEITGSHWDLQKNIPERKSGGGRWLKGVGKILEAYYMREDAKIVLDKIIEHERDSDRAAADYESKEQAAVQAEENFRKFDRFANLLMVQNERKDKIKRLQTDILKYEEILSQWPEFSAQLEKAMALKAEKSSRELLDKYDTVKKISDELNELRERQSRISCPAKTEINNVKSTLRAITNLENKLCGMNLSATVKMFGGNSVEIRSLRSGEIIDIADENVAISEAVKITIPNVMEMQLSPANVDVLSIQTQIDEQRQIISSVFGRYGVDSAEALEDLSRQFADNSVKIETAESRLNILLGDTPFEWLELSVKGISGNIKSREELDCEISAICGRVDLSAFITAKQTIIEGFEKDYDDIDSLKAKSRIAAEELKKVKESLSGTENVPAEYLNISDPEAHLKMLQSNLKFRQQSRDEAFRIKTEASSRLESYKESLNGDPAANFEKAERILNEQKTLLAHWLHIAEVFKKQKESLSNNPMQDISASFTKYLGIISGGKVYSEFPEQDKLNMNIYSSDRLLDYEKLSEGTKETVSLAFRLAVLDHLFPEGNGVIVFDDTFTDMDRERTAQSFKLLKECATRHQVIFLTCKEEYIDLLGGKIIKIG